RVVEEEDGSVYGEALGAVDGLGVAKLYGGLDVVGGQVDVAVGAVGVDAAVGPDLVDGPGGPVAHGDAVVGADVAVVVTGDDPITGGEPGAVAGGDPPSGGV